MARPRAARLKEAQSILLESGFTLAIDGENMQVTDEWRGLGHRFSARNAGPVQRHRPNPVTHYINATVQEIIPNGTDVLGRIRAVLDQVVGLLDGSESGVMYSQFIALFRLGNGGHPEQRQRRQQQPHGDQRAIHRGAGPWAELGTALANSAVHSDIVGGQFQLDITDPATARRTW